MYNINYSFYCHAPKTQKNKKNKQTSRAKRLNECNKMNLKDTDTNTDIRTCMYACIYS